MSVDACSSLSLSPPVSYSALSALKHKDKVIYVGALEVLGQLSEVLSKTSMGKSIKVDLDPLCEDTQTIIYGRDFRVILPDSTHLIPYSIKNPYSEFLFKAFLPKSCHEIIKSSIRCGYGTGFSKEAHHASLSIAEKLGIETNEGKSVIEGGNCLFFQASDGSKRALIGLSSVTLSMISLQENNYFEEQSEALKAKYDEIEDVEDDFYRMAKNSLLLSRFLPIYDQLHDARSSSDLKTYRELSDRIRLEFGGTTGINKALMQDVGESDKEEMRLQARSLKAKWLMTQDVIASELKMNIDHIAFIAQTQFHIDLSLFVLNGGHVFYHDEEIASSILEYTHPFDRRSINVLQDYKKQSKASMDINKQWKQMLIQEVERLGCQAFPVAGCFICPSGAAPINLMNSLILENDEEKVMVSSFSGFEEIDGAFERSILEKVSLKIVSLDPKTMMYLYERTSAGIHCITWDYNS